MGNNNSSKCELTEYSNVCEMAKCLTGNVVGLSSDSASPTDTWIVDFIDGTTHENEPIKNAFLKMWISNETFKRTNTAEDDKFQELMAKNSGLNYEVAVYRDIVKPLIETNICTNFIKFLGAGKDCSFDDVVSMAMGSGNKSGISSYEDNVFSTSVIIANDNNSIMKRKKITDTYTTEEVEKLEVSAPRKTVKEKFTYNIIANEVIKPGTMSLSEFLDKTVDNVVKSKVIFQALAACYAMSCSKMIHNDLHLGNVYIEPLNEVDESKLPPGWSRKVSSQGKTYYYNQAKNESTWIHPGITYGKSTRMNYLYGGDLYTFETNYIAKVFDFDRSYVQRFGNNPFLHKEKDWVCDDYSQCNKYIENLDALKLMSGIYRTIDTSYKDELLDICTQAEGAGVDEIAERQEYKKLLEEVFEEGGFLTQNDVPLTTDEYLQFNPTIDIMKNLVRSNFSKGSIQSTYPVGYIPNPKHTFVCNTDMFNKQGKISNINVAKGINDKTTITELSNKISQLEIENKILKEALLFQAQSCEKSAPPKKRNRESLSDDYSEFYTPTTKKPPKKRGRPKTTKIPCKPGEVRDKVTGECRKKKKPGRAKKVIDRSPEKTDANFPDFGEANV